jgi:hypothetical protein
MKKRVCVVYILIVWIWQGKGGQRPTKLNLGIDGRGSRPLHLHIFWRLVNGSAPESRGKDVDLRLHTGFADLSSAPAVNNVELDWNGEQWECGLFESIRPKWHRCHVSSFQSGGEVHGGGGGGGVCRCVGTVRVDMGDAYCGRQ